MPFSNTSGVVQTRSKKTVFICYVCDISLFQTLGQPGQFEHAGEQWKHDQ